MNETAAAARPVPPPWLYWLTLLLIFVTPGQLAYAVDKKHGPFIALADVVALVVGGLFALWVLAGRHLRHVTWPPLALWAWLAVAVLSAMAADNLTAAALEIIQIALYFGVAYMLFVNVLQTDAQRRTGVRVLLAATTLAVLYGAVQYATAAEPQDVTSIFQSRSAYGGFLAIVLPLFFGLTLWSELTWERTWTGLLIVLGGLTILSPPLVWVTALVLVLMAGIWSRGKKTALTVLAAAAFLAVTVAVAPLNQRVFREMLNPYEEGPIYKAMDVTGEGAPAAEGGEADPAAAGPFVKKRWIEWMPALNMLGEHYVLGVGTGNYQLNIGQPEYYGFLPNVKKSEADTNNLYLVTGGSMGIAGLVCLLAYIGTFWKQAASLWMHGGSPWHRALASGLYGACLAILTVNLFTSVFVRGTALAWALIFALIMAIAAEREATPRGDDR